MERHQTQIAAAGLKTVAVGLGQSKHARRYCPRLAPSAVCLASPDTSAHTAYGLKRGGLRQLAGPEVIAAALRAASQGKVQGRATGDARMLSGTFVIDRDGTVRAAFYGRHAGDLPEIGTLLSGLRPATARRQGWSPAR